MNFKGLTALLEGISRENILFVGLGNEWRGDDAAGLLLLRRLRQRPELKHCQFLEAGTNPENYLHDMLDAHATHIVIIDAARTGNSPGSISLLEKGSFDSSRISTHTFSIDLIEDYLNRHKPATFFYLGIEPLSTEFDTMISDIIKEKLEAFFQN